MLYILNVHTCVRGRAAALDSQGGETEQVYGWVKANGAVLRKPEKVKYMLTCERKSISSYN